MLTKSKSLKNRYIIGKEQQTLVYQESCLIEMTLGSKINST